MLRRASLAVLCANASLILLGVVSCAGPAFAYRPFDGTDAAVAAPGEIEVELQPAGIQHEQGTQTLIAPWTVVNIGLSEGWEAVFEGRGETPLSPSGPSTFTAAGAFSQGGPAREGSLQGQVRRQYRHGIGLLLPDSRGDSRLGASVAGIVSQRWDWGSNPPQYGNRADAGPSHRRLCWNDHRRSPEMEGAACR